LSESIRESKQAAINFLLRIGKDLGIVGYNPLTSAAYATVSVEKNVSKALGHSRQNGYFLLQSVLHLRAFRCNDYMSQFLDAICYAHDSICYLDFHFCDNFGQMIFLCDICSSLGHSIHTGLDVSSRDHREDTRIHNPQVRHLVCEQYVVHDSSELFWKHRISNCHVIM